MDSYSGIIIEESRRSEQFSDFTPIPCKGFNILCKAKRYGRWWVLKGLKKPYRQDGNYKNLLHKEFDILIFLQHPNIVSAYSMEDVPEMGICIVMEWIDGITLEHWNGRKTFCITGTSRRTPIRRQEDNRQDVEGIRHRHHPVC